MSERELSNEALEFVETFWGVLCEENVPTIVRVELAYGMLFNSVIHASATLDKAKHNIDMMVETLKDELDRVWPTVEKHRIEDALEESRESTKN